MRPTYRFIYSFSTLSRKLKFLQLKSVCNCVELFDDGRVFQCFADLNKTMLATVRGLLCFSYRADLLAQAVLAQMSNPQDMSFELVHHDRVSNLMTSVFEITPTNTTTALDVSQLQMLMCFTMALSSHAWVCQPGRIWRTADWRTLLTTQCGGISTVPRRRPALVISPTMAGSA